MDTITHIVLGACTGELIAGKSLGKKALLIGAAANAFPDVDVITALWLPTDQSLLAHRGFTHSFVFTLLVALLLAVYASRWKKVRGLTPGSWAIFIGTELFLHLFIDAFNAYGTGWFEPFSHERISFNTLFVADPFFTISILTSALLLAVFKLSVHTRRTIAVAGLFISTAYFFYAVTNKLKADRVVRSALANQHVTYNQLVITPTPLNTWLWFVVASDDSGSHVGYYSVFDSRKNIQLTFFPRNNYFQNFAADKGELNHLVRFSNGFYTMEKTDTALVFNDLRFGQVAGWRYPQNEFVFHYYLNQPGENKLVMQRGRFSRWNRETFQSLIKRIKGN